MVFLIINHVALSPLRSVMLFWLTMTRMRKSTSAGASMFSAVPPMVWSALSLIAAKARSMENNAPSAAAASMVRNI